MTKVIFLHDNRVTTAVAHRDEAILTVARRAGVTLESPCNGNGTCGKCKIEITDSTGHRHTVLACRTLVCDEMVVEIVERRDGANLQIKQDGLSVEVGVDSTIQKRYFPIGNVTEVYRNGELIATEQANTSQQVYGLAVDIGTTTLVVSLVDLLTGKEIAAAGVLNPQSRLAQDVLSRIRYASDDQRLAQLQQLFIDELNRLIKQITGKTGISADKIYDIVFSGNTCMLHLAVKANPAALGKYPYTPLIRGGDVWSAIDLGIHVGVRAQVYLPPIISAYVGADITSGILASNLAEQTGITLFIDIGTNGEMVLAVNGTLVATSTAAGPAFEGMNISCGMRAAPGAIESFHLAFKGERVVTTIDDQPAVGICGSGLLDIVAELVKHGVIGKNGKFSKLADEQCGAVVTEVDGKFAFSVTDQVFLSQQDVRQVQLAKGAIRAGIEALLDQQSLKPEAVDQVLIAGSFGYHLNPASLIQIGLLPEEFRNKIKFLGNTSKTGGQAFLVNRQWRRQIGETIANVAVLELATIKNFDRLFIKCLDYP